MLASLRRSRGGCRAEALSCRRSTHRAGSPQAVQTSVPFMSHTLDVVDSAPTWQPLGREESRQLRRDDQLYDRSGREWTVRATAYLDAELGEYRVVLVAGAQG